MRNDYIVLVGGAPLNEAFAKADRRRRLLPRRRRGGRDGQDLHGEAPGQRAGARTGLMRTSVPRTHFPRAGSPVARCRAGRCGCGACATRAGWPRSIAGSSACCAARIRCSRASAIERLERPVAARRAARSRGCCSTAGCAASACCRLDRHVLPDELPEEAAQRPVRRRARQRPLRGQARDALRLGQACAGAQRMPAAATRIREVQPPVDHRLQGPLLLAAGRARAATRAPRLHHDRAIEPVPGLSAADPARPHLARAARARAARAASSPSRPSSTRRIPPTREDVYERARVFDGYVDAINATDGIGRQLPHVERRGLRAADPRRLCAGHADLLPRPEPHRHPGRHPRRRRAWACATCCA